MVYSQKYCLVQMLSPIHVGDEFKSHGWPLHCTIAGVFALKWTESMRQEFASLIADIAAFESKTTSIAWFGPNKTVKVRRLQLTDDLYLLHDQIVTFIERYGGTFNEPRFLLQDFSPHITMRGEMPDEGEVVSFHQLALIDMFPDADHTRRRITALLPLAMS